MSSGEEITIPLTAFQDALAQRVVVTLKIGDSQLQGYIKFLPTEESETFSGSGFIYATSGAVIANDNWVNTDFIDISDVTDIVLTTVTEQNASPLYAYDEAKRPLRSILPVGTYESEHVEPDGSYRYIRSSARVGRPMSLELHFHD